MQGGYQLLDFGGINIALDETSGKVKIPYNLRDYVGKQVRISNLRLTSNDSVIIDNGSVITCNTIVLPNSVNLIFALIDSDNNYSFFTMTQRTEDEDYLVLINNYVI